jgi:hypothetical protein
MIVYPANAEEMIMKWERLAAIRFRSAENEQDEILKNRLIATAITIATCALEARRVLGVEKA